MAERLGPVCRHVCPTCGGCPICCPGHEPDEDPSEALTDEEEGSDDG